MSFILIFTSLCLLLLDYLAPFEQAWIGDLEQHPIQGKTRQRRDGGGRKRNLNSVEDKRLFILVDFRLYPTQAGSGFWFGLGQPQAHEGVHKLSGVLNPALGYEKQLPQREPHRLEAVLQQCPSLELLIDGTERRINRPKDHDHQKQYDSGKQKAHTLKNNVMSVRRGKGVFLSDPDEGKKHDKAIADEEKDEFLQGSKLW